MSVTATAEAVHKRMGDLLEAAERDSRPLTADELREFDRLSTQSDDLARQHQSFPQNSIRWNNTPPDELPFVDWLRGRIDDAEYRSHLPAEARAQAVGTNSAGGYLVPPGWRQKLVERMKAFGAVRSVAEIANTDSGEALQWPTNDDTGNVGAILAENTQMSEQDATIGTATLGAYMYSSKLIRVSYQLIDDAGFDVETWLAGKLGLRIARAQNAHFTTGTGSSQPTGIVTGATSGVTAASTTVITINELIDLQHSVDPAYREAGNCKWMMSDTALKGLRKLQDADNRPLVEPDLRRGGFSTLLGDPVVINNDMAAPAAGVKAVLYGNFQAGYVVRDVNSTRLLRLVERYADYLQAGFTAFHRSDGVVQDAYAYKALTMAAS